MLKFLFDKVAGLQTRNFLKKRLQHRCFPMKLSLIVFRWNQPLWKIHDIASINFDCFTINVSNQLKLSSEITWCHRYLFWNCSADEDPVLAKLRDKLKSLYLNYYSAYCPRDLRTTQLTCREKKNLATKFVMKTYQNIQEPSDRQTEAKLVRLFSARTE